MFIARKNIALTLPDLAKLVSGKLSKDTGKRISNITPLENSANDSLTLFTGTSSSRLTIELADRECGVVLVKPGIASDKVATIAVADPIAALVALIPSFYEKATLEASISPRAEVNPTAKIGKNVHIDAFCVIGSDVTIEDDVVIHPQVVIYPGAKIGRATIIHAGAIIREFISIGSGSVIQNGAVIGSDGFGYFPSKEGLEPVPQVGTVELAAKVDVGANSCIDRATLGVTTIGPRTKLDNLVQIGHNVEIGSNSIICGLVGVAGSSRIGNQVVLGGNVGVSDHIHIADKARFAAKSGVSNDIEEPGDYGGYPAVPVKEWFRQLAAFRRLPKILRKRSGE